MTSYRVRTNLTNPPPADETIRLLDWAPAQTAATIQVGEDGSRFFDFWRAPRPATDLALMGAAAYCVDKATLRSDAADRWTRDLELILPVANPDTWDGANWSSVMNFLTGDRWTIGYLAEPQHPLEALKRVPVDVTRVGEVDAVCLFSGGLDSLAGVIDLLEGDPNLRLSLLSHNEGGQASTAQETLLAELRTHYGEDRLAPKRLFLRPAPADDKQARTLPAARDNTTRARSLLFLTTALSMAASISPTTPVYIPENGFIGINVPLTRARSGSYSTRTTHPYFIKSLSEAAAKVGVANPIVNPFRHSTKGEMLAATKNPRLLARLAPHSVSCSHPEAARFVQRPQGNCGYCFPCLIRRSAMAHVGWDSPTGYAWDALDGRDLLDRDTRRAADLRAVINGAYADRPDRDILRNGPIPDAEHQAFIRVWRAGLDELRAWLSGATGATRALIETAS